jgi:hypothetical protein
MAWKLEKEVDKCGRRGGICDAKDAQSEQLQTMLTERTKDARTRDWTTKGAKQTRAGDRNQADNCRESSGRFLALIMFGRGVGSVV